MNRDYRTWEEDFTSNRNELFGFEGEMIASIDKIGNEWRVSNPEGQVVSVWADLASAKKAAEKIADQGGTDERRT